MLMKLLVVIGAMALIVTLLADDGRGPGPVTAWDDLSNTLEAGIDLPEFDDPFAEEPLPTTGARQNPVALANGDPGGFGNPNQFGCNPSEDWLCVRDFEGPDGAESYVLLEFSAACAGDPCPIFHVDLNGPHPGTLRSVSVDIWCRTPDESEPRPLFVQATALNQWDTVGGAFNTLGTSAENGACLLGAEFHKVTLEIPSLTAGVTPNNDYTIEIRLFDNAIGNRIDVSTVSVFGTFSQTATCSGGDFFGNTGCQIARFFDSVSRGFQFLINGASFVFTSVGAYVVFFGQVAAGLFFGMTGVMSFFLALPDTPAPVQFIFAIGFISMIGAVFYIVVKLIRGGVP